MEKVNGKKNPHDRLIDCVRNGTGSIHGPIRFSMKHYFNIGHPCGTVACISGFAGLMLGKTSNRVMEDGIDSLVEFLGVSVPDAKLMAYAMAPCPPGMSGGRSIGVELEDITADQAIKMLEIHRDTGKVDWPAAIAAFPPESATQGEAP